jgi:hypothetical protein
MGLDRLTALLLLALVAAACSSGGGRPVRLLDGSPAAHFSPVSGSVMTAARVLRRADIEQRVDSCLFHGDRDDVAHNALVVERVGVDGESLTFANRRDTGVYACDGGIDPAGERPAPWCASVFGELAHGQLLDARLDVICRDRARRPLAYAFVDPVAGAHWVGVQQDGYVELYEILGGLPVRISSTRAVDTDNARAVFDVAQYDRAGSELVREKLEAAVAG